MSSFTPLTRSTGTFHSTGTSNHNKEENEPTQSPVYHEVRRKGRDGRITAFTLSSLTSSTSRTMPKDRRGRLPLKPSGSKGREASDVTSFQKAVYDVCRRVPQGLVTTYGAIARALQSSPRAVGQALRHNPFAPVVPCHRVVRSDLDLGGFGGEVGLHSQRVKKKKALLLKEGVRVIGSQVADRRQVLTTLPALV